MHINLTIKPSFIFFTFSLVLVLATALLIIWLPILLWQKNLLLLYLLMYFSHFIWRFILLKSSQSILHIRFYENAWTAMTAQGPFNVEVLGDSFVSLVLIILRLRVVDTGRMYTAVLFNDSLKANELKQLCVVLRYA